MLVNRGKPEHVAIPHEPGEWFEFFKPNWKTRDEARAVREKSSRDVAKDFGPDFIAAITAGGNAEKEAREAVEDAAEDAEKEYQIGTYDTGSMLVACIHDWSYKDADGNPIEVTPQESGQLDPKTATWAMRHIVSGFRPPTEEESKNS